MPRGAGAYLWLKKKNAEELLCPKLYGQHKKHPYGDKY